MAKKTGALKKRVVKVEPSGQAHVHSSFNNIIVIYSKIFNIYNLIEMP